MKNADDWNYDDPFPDDIPVLALFQYGDSGDVDGEMECVCRFTTGFHDPEGYLIADSGGYAAHPVAWKALPIRCCERCRVLGPFIDGGETCWNCLLVQ